MRRRPANLLARVSAVQPRESPDKAVPRRPLAAQGGAQCPYRRITAESVRRYGRWLRELILFDAVLTFFALPWGRKFRVWPNRFGEIIRRRQFRIDKSQGARHSAAARLDRFPIGFQKRVMWLTAYVFFFELGDLNNFAFAAPELQKQWELSIDTIGLITSAAFIGMFVGAIAGG